MIYKKELNDTAFECQIYAEIDKIYIQEIHYNLIKFLFTKKIEFIEDFVWDIYLAQIQKTDYSLDSNIWMLNNQLNYPENKYEESRKIIEFCEYNIKNIATEISRCLMVISILFHWGVNSINLIPLEINRQSLELGFCPM